MGQRKISGRFLHILRAVLALVWAKKANGAQRGKSRTRSKPFNANKENLILVCLMDFVDFRDVQRVCGP
jgi:hypothetical protein